MTSVNPSTVDGLVRDWRVRPGEDCCSFADYIVQGLHGYSLLPDYESEHAFLSRFGGDLKKAVSEFVPNPVEAEDLETGDLCMIEVLDEQSVGIVVEDRVAVLLRDGLPRYISRAFVDSGWKL